VFIKACLRVVVHEIAKSVTELIKLSDESDILYKVILEILDARTVIVLGVFLKLCVVHVISDPLRKNRTVVVGVIENEVTTASTVEADSITGTILKISGEFVYLNLESTGVRFILHESQSDRPVTVELEIIKFHIVGDGSLTVPRIEGGILEVFTKKVPHGLGAGDVDIISIKH
jgi:hypothetical protein